MEPGNELKSEQRKNDPLREKSFQLAVRIVRLYRYLTEEKKEWVLSKQILRSGTNPGAMVREAANAESGLDFVHKLGIAQKETSETQYWLELLHVSEYLTESEFQSIYADTEEIMKLLRSSILTKKKKMAAQAGAVILLTLSTLLLL
jgi:four helix bundle protein